MTVVRVTKSLVTRTTVLVRLVSFRKVDTGDTFYSMVACSVVKVCSFNCMKEKFFEVPLDFNVHFPNSLLYDSLWELKRDLVMY